MIRKDMKARVATLAFMLLPNCRNPVRVAAIGCCNRIPGYPLPRQPWALLPNRFGCLFFLGLVGEQGSVDSFFTFSASFLLLLSQ